jgi:hypothetical protein
LAIIGTIDGNIDRKSNYNSGAAKEFVTRYAEGLKLGQEKTGVKAILINSCSSIPLMTKQIKE